MGIQEGLRHPLINTVFRVRNEPALFLGHPIFWAFDSAPGLKSALQNIAALPWQLCIIRGEDASVLRP